MRLLICLVMLVGHVTCDAFDEEQYGVKYANDCEVCKIVTEEFVTLLKESAGKHEVLETGYSVQVGSFPFCQIQLVSNHRTYEHRKHKY